MRSTLTCPSCGRLLVLPFDCKAELLSCPRCLTRIDNPQAAGATSAVPVEAPPVRESAVTASSASRESKPGLTDLDVEVARDTRRTGYLMTLLATIGGAGIAFALLSGVVTRGEGKFRPMLIVACVLALLTPFSAVWAATHRNGSFLGRTILGVLTISGAILVAPLLCVAALIFLVVICLP